MAGISDTNINNKKCLSISDDVGDDVDPVVVLSARWILNPKIKKQARNKKEIRVRRLSIIPGTITTASPWLVCCCSVTALLSSMYIYDRDNRINVNKNNNSVMK
jgi:hypothetical protein